MTVRAETTRPGFSGPEPRKTSLEDVNLHELMAVVEEANGRIDG